MESRKPGWPTECHQTPCISGTDPNNWNPSDFFFSEPTTTLTMRRTPVSVSSRGSWHLESMLVVFSRSKKKRKKSQDQEEENSKCLSKLNYLELKPRTPGQIMETLQTIWKICTAWWVGVASKLPSRLCIQYRWLWFLSCIGFNLTP